MPSGHIQFIKRVSCSAQALSAEDWTTSDIIKHTSFIDNKYRDQNSDGPSSLTVRVPINAGPCGCRLQVQMSSGHPHVGTLAFLLSTMLQPAQYDDKRHTNGKVPMQ